MKGWIGARARLHSVVLQPDAMDALAFALGPDTERIENEVQKLGAYANGAPVTAADVRALVSGAIESDIFQLTTAVVRRNHREAVPLLERLLAEGNAPQQILALLLWQFRVLLFASTAPSGAEAERQAKAIRSSSGRDPSLRAARARSHPIGHRARVRSALRHRHLDQDRARGVG